MQYFLIILSVAALIVFALIFPYATISVHYKDFVLSIKIKHFIFKKSLVFDFNKDTTDRTPKRKDGKNPSSESGRMFNIKERLNILKDRIYKKDTGFNLDEVKNVKEELSDTYSLLFTCIRCFFEKARYKIHIPLLRVKLEYGTGNPANTGMIYGSVWGLIGLLYPIAARYFYIAFPQADITPDFYGKRFKTEIKSIIKVRPAHIINAAVYALTRYTLTCLKNKIRKGRDK